MFSNVFNLGYDLGGFVFNLAKGIIEASASITYAIVSIDSNDPIEKEKSFTKAELYATKSITDLCESGKHVISAVVDLGYIAANVGKLVLGVATTGYEALPERTQITALVENIYNHYICNDDCNTNTDYSTHNIFNDECNKLALLAGDFALINKDGSDTLYYIS